MLVVGHSGPAGTIGAYVVARRPFAGYWEYLLEEAIFTAPPHPNWGGTALIGLDGKLLGIGSLFVPDARREPSPLPGNMFVPIDLLKPILADLLASGRGPGPARPWLGINSTEAAGAIAVIRVAPASPAEQASLRRGEVILGLDGEKVSGLPEFYRKLWSCGEVRVKVRLDVLRAGGPRRIEVTSGNRYDYLKLRRSY